MPTQQSLDGKWSEILVKLVSDCDTRMQEDMRAIKIGGKPYLRSTHMFYDKCISALKSCLAEEIKGMKKVLGKHDGHNNDDRSYCYDCQCSAPEEEFTDYWLYNQAITDCQAKLRGREGMKMKKLRRCPFCGGKASFGCNPYSIYGYTIYCEDCGARSKSMHEYNKAVTLWNRRSK